MERIAWFLSLVQNLLYTIVRNIYTKYTDGDIMRRKLKNSCVVCTISVLKVLRCFHSYNNIYIIK